MNALMNEDLLVFCGTEEVYKTQRTQNVHHVTRWHYYNTFIFSERNFQLTN